VDWDVLFRTGSGDGVLRKHTEVSSAVLWTVDWNIFGEVSQNRKTSGFRNKLSMRIRILKSAAIKISDLATAKFLKIKGNFWTAL
jgi:hypothetical protein